ncbi:MAG: transporter related [Solirubrobacterales bacterium]|nr:transporter related [Solirubrobacterales bacterium]
MTRALAGNGPLRLDDPGTAWTVTAGRAQVFAVAPGSARRPLFALEAGETAFAAPAGLPFELLLVGVEEGTTVTAAPVARAPDAASWTERLAASETSLAEAARTGADRLERRAAHEAELRTHAYTELAGVLGGRSAARRAGGRDALLGAVRLVADRLGIAVVEPPGAPGADGAERLDAIARASGFRVGRVRLESGWFKADAGPLVALGAEGGPMALLPRRPGAYDAVDPVGGGRRRVDASVAGGLGLEAATLYRPLPDHALSARDVLRFVLRPVRADLVRLVLFGLMAGALSLLPPLVAETIFSRVVPGLERSSLLWLAMLLGVFALASFGVVLALQLAIQRLEGRIFGDLQAGIWDRVLALPLPFFRRYSAGNLTLRILGIGEIGMLGSATIATAAIALPVAVANLLLAFVIEPRLALFGALGLAGLSAAIVLGLRRRIALERDVQRANLDLFAASIQLVEAAGKLRVADAERRGFAHWSARFAALKRTFYAAQRSFAAITALTAGAAAVATVLVFAGAATLRHGALEPATFVAFNTAFVQAVAGVLALSVVATFVATAAPLYRHVRPVLEAVREADGQRTDPGVLSGAIEASHVSLRYAPDSPLVLDDVSFRVAAGEFLAIVGPSGSGKSSLVRVLLGFEGPALGSVTYDGKGLETLDLRAVRRQMGVVIQSARLLPGTVLRNIVGTRPLSLEDAWAAAEVAGIADDLRAMPMGMQTFVSEGAATLSGGQRQRLLIARGVAGRPRILILDEATSALDNRTQAQVSRAIGALDTTRIVIAHRLSTVRMADRVLVLDDGKVVQEGGFDELLEVDGPFRRLVRRQLV